MINTREITPRSLLKCLSLCAKNELPVMIWGPPGIGKTAMVTQFTKSVLNGPCIDVRLPGMDPSELRGLQIPDLDKKISINLLPEYLPQFDGPGTIFVDEITGATQDVQVQAYSLFAEKRIGKWHVPPGWFLVAAGNQIEDGAVYHEMGTALSDRLVHYKVVADVSSYLDWYLQPELGYPTEIATFLRMSSHHLEGNEEQVREGRLIGPSPRSWERVAKVIKSNGGAKKNNDEVEATICGIVGQQVAAEFLLALEDMDSADDTLAIMQENDAGKRRKMLPRKLAGIYNMIFAITSMCREKHDFLRGIEILNDMDALVDDGLPVGECKTFGIEMLLEKARPQRRMYMEITEDSRYLQFKNSRTQFSDAA